MLQQPRQSVNPEVWRAGHAPDNRVVTFEKLLRLFERSHGTIECVGPTEQGRHLLLKIAFRPGTRFRN
jgi:hypothetical protein